MAFPTTGLLDDFNRANESPMGGSWSVLGIHSFGLDLNTNQALNSHAGSTGGSFYNVSQFGGDSEAYATVATLPAATQHVRLWGRLSDGTISSNGYQARVSVVAGAANDTWQIFRTDSGTSTQVGATVTGPDIVAGDKFGFELVGSTLQMYRFDGASWTSIISRSDATYSAAGYIAATINDSTGRLDDFSGGTMVSAAAPSADPAQQPLLFPLRLLMGMGPLLIPSQEPAPDAVGLVAVSATFSASYDAATTAQATSSSSWEAAIAAAQAVSAPFEAPVGAATVYTAPLEAPFGAAGTASGPWDAPTPASATRSGGWEATLIVAAVVSGPWNAQQGVTATVSGPWEAPVGVTVVKSNAWEALLGLAAASSAPWEGDAAPGAVLAAFSIPFDSTQGVAATISGPLEAHLTVARAVSGSFEALVGVASLIGGQWEARGLIAVTFPGAWESVIPAILLVSGPWDAPIIVRLTAAGPWEAAGSVREPFPTIHTGTLIRPRTGHPAGPRTGTPDGPRSGSARKRGVVV